MAVVVVHKRLDARFGVGVHKTESLRELPLMRKAQLILFALSNQVQAEAYPPKKTTTFHQPFTF